MKINAIIAVFIFVMSTHVFADTPGEVKEGKVLREALMYGFAGDTRQLSELRGKPLLINVWASWCQPCRAEMGSLERLFKRYGGNEFNVIGISTDDDSNAASRFLRSSGVTFDNYWDYRLRMENMLGANTIPLTLLIDSQGRVLKKVRGYHQWDTSETIKMIGTVFNVKL